MTEPSKFGRQYVHPNQVVSLLLSLASELDTAARELDDLERALVEASEAHNVAHTQEFLKERAKDEPQYACTAMADSKTAELRMAMRIAEANVKAHKRKVETLEKRISVGQTACKTLQAEMDLARMPTGR